LYTLGINDGHNSSATIFYNGKLLCAISEERLSRKKNEYGFPVKAINYCLKAANIKKNKIDYVAVGTKNLPPRYLCVKRNTTFTVNDYIKEQNEYWFPKICKRENPHYLKIFKYKIQKKKDIFYDMKKIKNEDDYNGMRESRKQGISKFLKISKEKIFFYDHHRCHANYGLYSKGNLTKKTIVVTVDGGGDGCNGSIWIYNKNKFSQVYKTNICNIGRMYRYATLSLGFKPSEHEYKVMGLAGYGLKNNKHYEYAKKIYEDTLDVKGIEFFYKFKPKDNYFYFKNKLKNQRFDTISYAIQYNTERLLCKWFKNIYAKYKIGDFIFSGGVAENIKASKKILSLNGIKSLFVPPGPGDESISIGAAYILINDKLKIQKKHISSMLNPYVGSSYKKNDLNFIFKSKKIRVKKVNNKSVAKILNQGIPIARFSTNKSEFGPRALGNRSIIASPKNAQVIHHINESIKIRDFWMPFAPSIISTDFKKLLINKKNSFHNFMTTSLDSTEFAKKNIPGALHPFDRTSRPHIVYKKYNKDYFNLILEFKKISGVGCLLNTSFNVHGEPIVNSPKDAIKTLLKTNLKYLLIDNFLISKK